MLTLKECRKMYRHWVSGLYGKCKFRTVLAYARKYKCNAHTMLEVNGLPY